MKTEIINGITTEAFLTTIVEMNLDILSKLDPDNIKETYKHYHKRIAENMVEGVSEYAEKVGKTSPDYQGCQDKIQALIETINSLS